MDIDQYLFGSKEKIKHNNFEITEIMRLETTIFCTKLIKNYMKWDYEFANLALMLNQIA